MKYRQADQSTARVNQHLFTIQKTNWPDVIQIYRKMYQLTWYLSRIYWIDEIADICTDSMTTTTAIMSTLFAGKKGKLICTFPAHKLTFYAKDKNLKKKFQVQGKAYLYSISCHFLKMIISFLSENLAHVCSQCSDETSHRKHFGLHHNFQTYSIFTI